MVEFLVFNSINLKKSVSPDAEKVVFCGSPISTLSNQHQYFLDALAASSWASRAAATTVTDEGNVRQIPLAEGVILLFVLIFINLKLSRRFGKS